MSTEYSLYKDAKFGELTVNEMSNKLSIDFDFPPNIKDFDLDLDYFCSKKMPPEEIAKIFLQGLTVCSYWMDPDELKNLIKEHVEKEICCF